MKMIYEQLKEYGESDYYGFHMPGHKRNKSLMKNSLPYEVDITEINGFDDLHHAEGMIRDAQRRAAKLYHAEETHFLINGSTVGILSAILGGTNKGDKLLVARNCHKSVYHAMYLNELYPVYIYPKYDEEIGLNGAVDAEEIRSMLEQDREIKAVMIVSPTYDGVVSDIEEIAKVVHGYGIPLIVDEAHGAHFGFHSYFPKNANEKGADVVIHSVHKTLPALTQTALIHLNGTIVDREKVRMYLHMLQSSSPSYVLMSSIDACMELLEQEGTELFEIYVQRLKKIRQNLKKLKHLKLIEIKNQNHDEEDYEKRDYDKEDYEKCDCGKYDSEKYECEKDDSEKNNYEKHDCKKMDYDNSKLIISVRNTNLTSRELAWYLREKYHLEMEMTAGDYVLAMTSIGDTEEGFERLQYALFQIDKMIENERIKDKIIEDKTVENERIKDERIKDKTIEDERIKNKKIEDKTKNINQNMIQSMLQKKEAEQMWEALPQADVCYRSVDMMGKSGVSCAWRESIGEISMEYAYLYPPGIPIIVAGERVTESVIAYLEMYEQIGFSIEGLEKSKHIKIWKEKNKK